MPSAMGTCETIYCSFFYHNFQNLKQFSPSRPILLCYECGSLYRYRLHLRLRLALATERAHSASFSSTRPMTGINIESGLWASYQIRKIAGCACAGNAGNVSPRRRIQRKTRVSDPRMHHSTCVTHVPWCMSGLLTRGGGENVPGIPGACAPAIWRIWQEAHGKHDQETFVYAFDAVNQSFVPIKALCPWSSVVTIPDQRATSKHCLHVTASMKHRTFSQSSCTDLVRSTRLPL